MLAYVALRPQVGGPPFVFKDGGYLTRKKLVKHLQRALGSAGICTRGYSGHISRIRAVTTAAFVGVEDSVIKMLGRWESSAYQWYLRTARAAISARLVSGTP